MRSSFFILTTCGVLVLGQSGAWLFESDADKISKPKVSVVVHTPAPARQPPAKVNAGAVRADPVPVDPGPQSPFSPEGRGMVAKWTGGAIISPEEPAGTYIVYIGSLDDVLPEQSVADLTGFSVGHGRTSGAE